MSLSKLSENILAVAEADAEKIRLEASREACEIKKRYAAIGKGEAEAILSAAERKAELLLREVAGSARVNTRIDILEKKKMLLDGFFNEVAEKVYSLPDDSKKRLIVRLCLDAEKIPGKPVVYTHKETVKLVPNKYTVKTSSFKDFGVVIESQDGSMRIDNRLPKVLEKTRENFEHKLVKILWR